MYVDKLFIFRSICSAKVVGRKRKLSIRTRTLTSKAGRTTPSVVHPLTVSMNLGHRSPTKRGASSLRAWDSGVMIRVHAYNELSSLRGG